MTFKLNEFPSIVVNRTKIFKNPSLKKCLPFKVLSDLLQEFQLDYEARFQCAAILDVRPTIYGQHFWIREDTESRSIDCVAMEIFGNQAGEY